MNLYCKLISLLIFQIFIIQLIGNLDCLIKPFYYDRIGDYQPTTVRLPKIILLYNGFGVVNTHEDALMGSKSFSQCEYKECILSDDLSKAASVDVILWQHFIPRRPSTKGENQIWVAYFYESPAYRGGINRSMTNQVDWLISYSRFATIPMPYFKVSQLDNPVVYDEDMNIDYSKGKAHMVAVVYSHCETKSKRELFVKQLGKYIQVHVYGGCGGNRPCPNDCFKTLGTLYRFYLAFENSKCRDYITEKVYNALGNGMIPIVYGAHPDDYARLLPPNSYIYLEDFNSAKDLAVHLMLVASNKLLYNKYFQWILYYRIELRRSPWCELCQRIHQANYNDEADGNLTVVFPNLKEWYSGRRQCVKRWWRKKEHNYDLTLIT